MKNYSKYLIKFKSPKYYIPAAIVLIVVVWALFFRDSNGGQTSVEVKRGTVTQEVSVTGKTKSISSVDLSFERGGQVVSAPVSVGSRVSAGQVLVALDQSELLAQLTQARANLAAQEAKLAEVKRGSRPEDLLTTQSRVLSAEAALDSATRDLQDEINSAYVQADDAVRNHADKYFDNPSSGSPQFKITFTSGSSIVNFDITDREMKVDLGTRRSRMSTLFSNWKNEINTRQDLVSLTKLSKDNTIQIRDFLDRLSQAINSLSTVDFTYQATVNGYKTDVSTARTTINTTIDGLNTALEKYVAAQTSLSTTKNEYNSEKAGSTKEAVAAQEAQVLSAEGQVSLINAQLNKAVLVAPISGVVTKKEFELGENVLAGTALISIIADADLEIEANVPEVDIGKIAVGNPVRITLDAFPGEDFTGKVTYIDPAETLVDGVVNFKIKVVFDQADPRLKSGLTSNLNIQTLTKSNVLVIPQYALIENDNGTFVRVGNGNGGNDVPVKIGVRGLDGSVEILSGVKEGDKIVNIGMKTK